MKTIAKAFLAAIATVCSPSSNTRGQTLPPAAQNASPATKEEYYIIPFRIADALFECCNNGAAWRVMYRGDDKHRYTYQANRETRNSRTKIQVSEQLTFSADDKPFFYVRKTKQADPADLYRQFSKDEKALWELMWEVLGYTPNFFDPRFLMKERELLKALKKNTNDPSWRSEPIDSYPYKNRCLGENTGAYTHDDPVVPGASLRYSFKLNQSIAADYQPATAAFTLAPDGQILSVRGRDVTESSPLLGNVRVMQEAIRNELAKWLPAPSPK